MSDRPANLVNVVILRSLCYFLCPGGQIRLSLRGDARVRNEPSVSIVITYFDYANFLPETVASIASQTYRDFEVIVVDDCSPGDPARSILAGVDLANLAVLRLDHNLGPAAACNVGVRASKAPLIVAMDSDDLIEPTFLENTVAVLSDPKVGG